MGDETEYDVDFATRDSFFLTVATSALRSAQIFMTPLTPKLAKR